MSIKQRQLRALLACERGNITIEFALISFVFLAMLFGLFEYGARIHQTMQLSQAARAGVEYAMTYPSDNAGIQATVTNSTAMDTASMTVAVDQFCECPDGSPAGCSDTCSPGQLSNAYIRVTASQPPKAPLYASGFLSGSPIQASAVMRVR